MKRSTTTTAEKYKPIENTKYFNILIAIINFTQTYSISAREPHSSSYELRTQSKGFVLKTDMD